MHRFSRILIMTTGVVILTLSLAAAGAKFENKDTATNRQDRAFGTEVNEDTGSTEFGTNAAGDSTIRTKPRPKPEPVDWYDKIIITVSPTDVGTQTRTTTEQNASGDTTPPPSSPKKTSGEERSETVTKPDPSGILRRKGLFIRFGRGDS